VDLLFSSTKDIKGVILLQSSRIFSDLNAFVTSA